jgi:hypothetical protein
MPGWGGKSSNFKRNMAELLADDFPDDVSTYEPPKLFNKYAQQTDQVAELRKLVEGLERGNYRLDYMTMNLSENALEVRGLDGVPMSMPFGLVLDVQLRVTSQTRGPVEDDYPDTSPLPAEPVRAQVGASPPRQLILDED